MLAYKYKVEVILEEEVHGLWSQTDLSCHSGSDWLLRFFEPKQSLLRPGADTPYSLAG